MTIWPGFRNIQMTAQQTLKQDPHKMAMTQSWDVVWILQDQSQVTAYSLESF